MEKITNTQLISEINSVLSSTEYYFETLNSRVILLFLSTLACWSVSHNVMQIIAIFIVLLLFVIEVFNYQQVYRSNCISIEEIENLIKDSLLDEDIKKARLYDLDSMKKKAIKSIKIKKFPIILICIVYTAISLFIFISSLP